MTSELSPSARALLEAARDSGPDAATIARMRGKIDLAVATGATVSTGTAIGAKLAIVGVVGAVAAGGYAVTRDRGETPVSVTPVVHDGEPPRVPTVSALPIPIPPPTVENDETAIELEPNVRSRPVIKPPAKAAAVTGIDLAREVALIDRAMTALGAGDPTTALEAVRTHARQTLGKGQLAEDAAAIEIEAMCKLHQSVQAKLDAFDARWPTSAQRSRLTSSCK